MNTMFTGRVRMKDLEETLANSTALLAVVGAGDLAVEKLRLAREQIAGRSASFDPKVLREQAQATFLEGVEALQTEVQAAPDQIRALPEKAPEWPARAQAMFADLVAGAFTTYGELAGRGKNVVESVRAERPDVEPVKPVSRPAPTTAKSATTAKSTGSTKPTAKRTAKPAARKASSTAKSTSSGSAKSTSSGSAKSTPSGSVKSTSSAKKSSSRSTSSRTPASKRTSAKG